MKTDRKQLLGILEKLRPGLSAIEASGVEQAMNIIFKSGVAWTFNDEIAISHPLPDTLADLEGAVVAVPLLRLLNKLSDEIVDIEIGPGTEAKKGAETSTLVHDALKISGKSAVAEFALEDVRLPVESIPLPATGTWQKLPETFIAAVALAARSAGNMTTPILSFVSIANGAVYGCDAYQLTVVQIQKGWKASFLLPANVAPHLAGFTPDAFALVEGWIHFINADDVVLSCRTLDDAYPDMTKLLKVTGADIELPEALAAALLRADIFTESAFEKQIVKISIDKNLLTVTGTSAAGKYEEKLVLAGYKGVPVTFSANPMILGEALKLGTKIIIGTNALLMRGKDFIHVVCLQ